MSLGYSCRVSDDGLPYPCVLINGEVVIRGRLAADAIVKRIGELAARRLDQED